MNRFVLAALCAVALPLAALSSTDALAAGKKKAAKAAAALPALSADQVYTAERVLTGDIPCDANRKVKLEAVNGQPGYFRLGFQGKNYTVAPEATTTGAVRLEDKKAGLVWIQIANKSMLMNAKRGQRMADDCKHPSQSS
jgi:hypothetical protein